MSEPGIDTLLRGCERVYTPAELTRKLESARQENRPLRVKLGMDPTAPDIHLGHSVVLRKLRQFQDLGHLAVLIIGDFTARIGDPTGRSRVRPVLSDEQIRANAETYFRQAGRILDTSADRLEIRYNSEWLAPMSFADVIRLCAKTTVGQMLQRDDFRMRFDEQSPISLHELLYPLMQGWDSVQVRADIELGGTDQTYNNLVGRELQVDAGQEPQVVMILPLLRGTDGVKKMSKSLGNYIALTDTPRDLFGKTMSIPDECMPEWFTLLTDLPEEQWRATIHEQPKKAKALLAQSLGQRYHGAEAMRAAAEWWQERFGRQARVDEVKVRIAPQDLKEGCLPAWKLAWLAHGDPQMSNSEARRIVRGGAFEYDGQRITDPNCLIRVENSRTFRAGRHRGGEHIKQPLIARIVLE